MKNYNELQAICLKEVREAGIVPSDNIKWSVNRRAKRRWGLCTKKPNGEYEIQIAARLLEDDSISEKACKETIIHEILHSCKDAMGHTGKWKIYAEMMNDRYGYNIKRCTSGEEKGVENYKPREMPIKYIFCCSNCGVRIIRKRASKFTKHYRNYNCGMCGARRSFVRLG